MFEKVINSPNFENFTLKHSNVCDFSGQLFLIIKVITELSGLSLRKVEIYHRIYIPCGTLRIF